MDSTDNLANTYCFHHLMACADRPRMFISMFVLEYMVSSLKPHYASSPLWAPKIPYQKLLPRVKPHLPCAGVIRSSPYSSRWQDKLKRWWKCRIGKTELLKSTILFYIVFNIPYLFHQMCTLLYIMSLKKKKNHFQYKYTFYYQGYIWISKLYYN